MVIVLQVEHEAMRHEALHCQDYLGCRRVCVFEATQSPEAHLRRQSYLFMNVSNMRSISAPAAWC